MDSVSIVTATSDRPEAIALLLQYMHRCVRFVAGGLKVEWVIADDGTVPVGQSILDVARLFCVSVTHVRSAPHADPAESFRQNYIAGITAATNDAMLIMEDDDWYAPDYVAFMLMLLDHRPLVGAACSRFFNVRFRRWWIHENREHAGLSQTGIRGDRMRDKLLTIATSCDSPCQLDGHLWRRAGIGPALKLLLPLTRYTVGMKGLPGKGGAGIHHRLEELDRYTPDPTLGTLQHWIGNDTMHYRAFAHERFTV